MYGVDRVPTSVRLFKKKKKNVALVRPEIPMRPQGRTTSSGLQEIRRHQRALMLIKRSPTRYKRYLGHKKKKADDDLSFLADNMSQNNAS